MSDPYAAYGGAVASGGSADPYAAYGGSVAAPAAPPATPSLLDRAKAGFDALTTVTPQQEQGHSWLVNKAQEMGAGAIHGALSPIVHPLDTLGSLGSMIAHPIDSLHADVNSLESHPANYLGNVVGGAVLGEAAAPAIAPIAEAVKTGAGRVVLLGKTPEAAYESALKPSTTLSQADRASAVKAGLQNEIPVSKAGIDKIGDLIDDYNQKIKDTIASDPTRPIDPNAVATRADTAKARFSKQVNAQGDLNAIEASKQQFLREQGAPTDAQGNVVGPAPDMNASDAQAMKQGTYSVLKGKFGEQGSAAVEAQKALARGLKEEIASQFPEIDNLNKAESKLLDLQPILERAVNRIGNHQLIGIGTPVAGAAAKAVTGSGSIGVVAGALKAVLDNPAVKSKLAIAVSKGSKVPIGQAMARVQAYSSALGASAAGSTADDVPAYSSSGNPSQLATPQP